MNNNLISFTGKTLVCKEKAIQLDTDAPIGKNVLYISLLNTDGEGNPTAFQFVFDLITRWYDFGSTNVIFMDVRDLCAHYEKRTGKKSLSVDVYTLSLQFIEDHPNSHFVFDEVPFFKRRK